jgi:sporulation protein YlmC with PRC-barrel domain
MEKATKKARKVKSEKLNKILASEITVKQYEIDFDKIKSIDDVVVIFRAMKVTLNWYSEECPDLFKEIYEKGFLKEK